MKMNTRLFLRFILVLALLLVTSASVLAQKFAILSDIHVTPGNANEGKLMLMQ